MAKILSSTCSQIVVLAFLSLILSAALPAAAQAQGGDSRMPQLSTTQVKRIGFMIEPILTYGQANSSIRSSQLTPLLGDTGGKIESVGLGARVGLHAWQTLLFGVDGRYNRARFNDSALGNAEGDALNVGPMVGVQTPFYGVRLAATYIADGYFDPGAGTSGLDTRFNKMRGYRLGAGLKIYNVDVGLEYQKARYEDSQIQSYGSLQTNLASTIDLDSEGYSLNLSFPFEL